MANDHAVAFPTLSDRDLQALAARGAEMRWLLHKGTDIVSIPGTKRRRFLEGNAR